MSEKATRNDKERTKPVKAKKIISLPSVNQYYSPSEIEKMKHRLCSEVFDYNSLEDMFQREYLELKRINEQTLNDKRDIIDSAVKGLEEAEKSNAALIMQKKFLSQSGGKLLFLKRTVRYFVDSNIIKSNDPMTLKDLDGEWFFLRKDSDKSFSLIEFYDPLDEYPDTISVDIEYLSVVISDKFTEESRQAILNCIKSMVKGCENITMCK